MTTTGGTDQEHWGRVKERLRAEVGDTLRLYPDPGSDKLRAAIAKRHGLAAEQVFVGNGSDEVLAFVFQGLLASRSANRSPCPTRPG